MEVVLVLCMCYCASCLLIQVQPVTVCYRRACLSYCLATMRLCCMLKPLLECFPRSTKDWNVLPIDPSKFHTVDAFKSYLSCMNMCMNFHFVLICVWQLFFKNKRWDEHQSVNLTLFLTSSCYPAGNVAFLATVRSSSVRDCTFMEGEERKCVNKNNGN